MVDRPDFHIITGGPGSGKTTLIDALAAQGFHHMPEAGRAIIRDQMAIGGIALPWADRGAFAELMLGWELRSWHEAHDRQGPVIFDRGVPDVAEYLRLCGLSVPPHVARAAELFRYQRRVFIAPPWREIFGQDAERKQDFAEAQATYEAMVTVMPILAMSLSPCLSPRLLKECVSCAQGCGGSMTDRVPRSWQLLMVGSGVHRISPDLCDRLVRLLDLSPQTRLIEIETDQGGVSVSRDWPSDKMEEVSAIEAEIQSTPGIIRMTMFQAS